MQELQSCLLQIQHGKICSEHFPFPNDIEENNNDCDNCNCFLLFRGRYDMRRTPAENINLPPALLSRFDLLWLILDRADMESDLEMARHIVHVHQNLESPALGFTPLEPSVLRQV
jgi:hypothetical protein